MQLAAADGETVRANYNAQAEQVQKVWLELLRDGLAFDLEGLAPGLASEIPKISDKFDLDKSPASLRLEAIELRPGSHLAGAGSSEPVVRTMLALACDLILQFDDLVAVAWGPSQSVIGRRYFESVVSAWLDGGAFPALGLTSFRETIDGALQSVGLEFWIGQELRLEPPVLSDKVEATRLGVRLINQLILIGGIEKTERVVGPDGSRLIMRPSTNRKFIRVSRE